MPYALRGEEETLARANGSPGRYLQLATAVLAAALVLVTLPLSLKWLALWTAQGDSPGANHRPVPGFGNVPLQFEPNVGQTDPSALYLVHAAGGMLYFTPSGVIMSLAGIRGQGAGVSTPEQTLTPNLTPNAQSLTPDIVIRQRFVGANPAPEIESGAVLPGKVNYLIGSDPAQWRTGLPAYQDVTYTGLYPGVDLEYSGHGGARGGQCGYPSTEYRVPSTESPPRRLGTRWAATESRPYELLGTHGASSVRVAGNRRETGEGGPPLFPVR
jgi:hypothetical protein